MGIFHVYNLMLFVYTAATRLVGRWVWGMGKEDDIKLHIADDRIMISCLMKDGSKAVSQKSTLNV